MEALRYTTIMQWLVISGSWRTVNSEVVWDVQKAVGAIMDRGDGIVVGGALGVDSIATEEALKHNPGADRIRIIIPSSLSTYIAHYKKRAAEGVITVEQAESLEKLLVAVHRLRHESLIEMNHQLLNQETYYDRNTELLKGASGLLAFQVNDSQGTQDIIDKARRLRLAVSVKRYTIRYD